MPKSIEDIDRQIAALKEQKKRQQAQIAQKKREGLRSCKELIGEEVVNAFNNWTSIDLDLFAIAPRKPYMHRGSSCLRCSCTPRAETQEPDDT